MPPAGFETEILTSKRQETHALDRPATGIDVVHFVGRILCRRLRCICLHSILYVISMETDGAPRHERSAFKGFDFNPH
jgi:hypothetical protein